MYSYFNSQNRNHDKPASAKVYCNEKYTCAKNKVKVSNTKRMDKCYKHDDVQKYRAYRHLYQSCIDPKQTQTHSINDRYIPKTAKCITFKFGIGSLNAINLNMQ